MTTLHDAASTEPTTESLAKALEAYRRGAEADRRESQAQIAALKAEIAQLKAAPLTKKPPQLSNPDQPGESEVRTDRRGLFKVGGAAAVAAVGTAVGTGLLSSTPAAAANGQNVVLGQNNTASATTEVSTTSGEGVLGQSSGGNGLHGVTTAGFQSSGVLGEDQSGVATSAGVSGHSVNGYGIWGMSTNNAGVFGQSPGLGVYGLSSGNGGYGVYGLDDSSGGGYGVEGDSAFGYGLAGAGGLAPLWLRPSGLPGPPTTSSFHSLGEVYVDSNGMLYTCVSAGNPGTWVKQSPFVPLGPARAYTSTTDVLGPLATGHTRDVDLTGAGIPAGASAALVNLTVVNTTGLGFLTLYPQGATQPGTSNIGWYASNQSFANNATTKVGSTGKITVAAGGLGSTNFIIDVFGFYY
jgi:hypothetical protein